MLDAGVYACFDGIDPPALMRQVGYGSKDKRVLAPVKTFLKTGVMTETDIYKDSHNGPRKLSVLGSNTAIDELIHDAQHLHGFTCH